MLIYANWIPDHCGRSRVRDDELARRCFDQHERVPFLGLAAAGRREGDEEGRQKKART